MARKQLKKHRLFSSERPSSTAPDIPSSEGASHPSADAPSAAGPSANTPRNLFSRMGHLFHRSNQARSEPPTTETTHTRLGGQINTAQQDTKPIPQVLETAVGLVGQADIAVTKIQSIEAILQPLKLFKSFATTLSNVHPYVQFALGILTAASQLLINQANLDGEVFGLLNTVKDLYEFLMEKDTIENMDSMKETLRRISQEMSVAALFVIKYCEKRNISIRIGDSLVSDPQTVARGHVKNLSDLMQQYRDRAIRDIQVNMSHVLEDLNLEGMAYAAGAGLNTTKKCLDGTRTEILKDIIDWITRSDDNAPRILWLHGQAGRGKSAIAHTIASWVKAVGAPGTCFCFARDRQAERREEKILTTIARDLADRDPAFRRALSNVVSNNHTLKTTRDVAQQWERFILEPLSKINGEIVGNVVVVIDALDESGPERSRKDILSLLKTSEATHLPANFRILLTSRTLPDIERAMRDVPHVKATSLDNVRRELVERDIRLYVSKELGRFPSIGATEVQNVVKKSDGLFEWARRACEFIRPGKPGVTLKERYDDLMALESEEARTLLDTTYFAILEGSIPQSGKRLEQYRSVMQQIVMTLEPLPMAALNSMRENFPNKQDRYDVILILEFMSPVLGGIVDRVSAVRPLHESFYDFLTDHSRSGIYFIDTSNTQHTKDLAFAALQILHDNLRFNICELESSYLANAEVDDLSKRIEEKIPHHLSYSSRFWARHLQKMVFDLELAVLVKAIIGSKKILFWLEIISLLGMVGKGVKALGTVATWLQGQDGFKDILELVEDEIKLIQNFGSVMVHSTPHLYASALPFIPSNALLSMMLLPNFPGLARVVLGGLNRWPVEQQLLHGHTSEVKSVTFSPDGKRIVSSSRDNTVRVWDVERGVQIGGPLEGHTDGVKSVTFSPDGKRIVSSSRDNTVRVWDAERGVQIGGPLEGHTDGVNSVAFSPNGKRIVSGSRDNTVRVWDAERGVQIGGPLEGHTDGVDSVAFSLNGKSIVSGSKDNTVRVWDAEIGVQIGSPLEGHTNGVNSVAFSPAGKQIVSGSWDRTVRVWNAPQACLQMGSPPDRGASAVKSVAFSSDGKKIVSGSDDKTVRVWDVERGALVRKLEGHSDAVNAVALSPDGEMIASGSWDETVRVWDVGSGVQIFSPIEGHTDAIFSVAFSPDGKRIASGSDDQTVRVWDAGRGVQIGSPLEGHTSAVESVAFSLDGKIASGSRDKTVRVWNTGRGTQIGSPLEAHTGPVFSVVFSPDGKRIVSGSWDGTIRIWDVERGVQVGSPLLGHNDAVFSVAFSPNGKTIISGSDDKTVRIWDVERGVQVGSPLESHTDAVNSVAFSPDGKCIVSCSNDNTIRVWDVQSCGDIISDHEKLKVRTFNPKCIAVLSHSTDIIKGYPISFSSSPSHALHDPEQLFDGFMPNMFAQEVKLDYDGWIRGPQGRLLLWIPPAFRQPFYSVWTTSIIPIGHCIELDLSLMAHGKSWHKCLKEATEY